MSLKHDIRKILESTFDLPFVVEADHSHPEPCFSIAPSGSNDNLFSVQVEFQNQIRMEMDFEPQRYAAQMVREMGKADGGQKDVFCSFAGQLSQKGSKISLTINGIPYSPENHQNWPSDWEKVHIRVVIRPIDFDKYDKPDYFTTITKWLPIMMGASLSLLNVVKVENDDDIIGAVEGKKYDVITSRYERNPINRILCLAQYGYKCQVCGFDFEEKYGSIGKNFIHVHHIIPVSQMGEDYHVNPTTDLIPVCPNCHAMLHKENPPISPERLREIIEEARTKS